MERFNVHVGVAVPLRRSSVDTDQIIPARFVKRTARHGYADALFANLRDDPDFVLNHPAFKAGSVLVSGADFGIGSSREQAVWALQDYGFRVVIAPSFGDIFRSNAGNVGLLTATVAAEQLDVLWAQLSSTSVTELRVDLESRTVRMLDDSWSAEFHVPDGARRRLLSGLDWIDESLAATEVIDTYERTRSPLRPTVRPLP